MEPDLGFEPRDACIHILRGLLKTLEIYLVDLARIELASNITSYNRLLHN